MRIENFERGLEKLERVRSERMLGFRKFGKTRAREGESVSKDWEKLGF